MLSLAWILVFIKRGSIEAPKRVRVAREVRRDPIEDHANPGLVAAIDEVAKIIRRAEA